MKRIAVITNCEDRNNQQNLLSHFKTWVEGVLVKRVQQPWEQKIELLDNIEVYVITVPYSVSQLAQMGNSKLERLCLIITKMLKQIDIDESIVANELDMFKEFNQFCRSNSYHEPIIRILLGELIEKIFLPKHFSLAELDVAIIVDNDISELEQLLTLMSTKFKFVTLLSTNAYTDIVDKIYDDTGLAVRVTSDFKHGLKNCDLIINSSVDIQLLNIIKLDKESIVINMKKEVRNKIFWNNTVINGLSILLPQKVIDKIDSVVFQHIDSKQFSEIVFSCIYNHALFVHQNDGKYSDRNVLAMKLFEKYGFNLVEVIGHRTVIEIDKVQAHTAL